jgi:hypothetical protein
LYKRTHSTPLNFIGFYGNYRLEASYKLAPSIDIGGYFGATGIRNLTYFSSESLGGTQGYFYGVNGYYHFSDLIFKGRDTWFDFYLKGKTGGYSVMNAGENAYSTSLDMGFTLH